MTACAHSTLYCTYMRQNQRRNLRNSSMYTFHWTAPSQWWAFVHLHEDERQICANYFDGMGWGLTCISCHSLYLFRFTIFSCYYNILNVYIDKWGRDVEILQSWGRSVFFKVFWLSGAGLTDPNFLCLFLSVRGNYTSVPYNGTVAFNFHNRFTPGFHFQLEARIATVFALTRAPENQMADAHSAALSDTPRGLAVQLRSSRM